jgi:hypothetical protein
LAPQRTRRHWSVVRSRVQGLSLLILYVAAMLHPVARLSGTTPEDGGFLPRPPSSDLVLRGPSAPQRSLALHQNECHRHLFGVKFRPHNRRSSALCHWLQNHATLQIPRRRPARAGHDGCHRRRTHLLQEAQHVTLLRKKVSSCSAKPGAAATK